MVGLVQNSLDILVSFSFQMLFFHDLPGHWKVVGAGLIFTSVISVGAAKVRAARREKTGGGKL